MSSKKIILYISDHGFGHAARQIRIIRELLAQFPNVEIIVKTSRSLEFVSAQVKDPRLKTVYCENDFGVVNAPDNFEVDAEQTTDKIMDWIDSWDSYITREIDFCKTQNASLIISDSSPQPLTVANKLGIPGIFTGNFTWTEIYTKLCEKYDETLFEELEESLETLEDTYNQATHAIFFPLNNPNGATKEFNEVTEVGMVARKVSVPKAELKQTLGLPQESKIAYLGMGFSVRSVDDSFQSLVRYLKANGYHILTSSNATLSGEGVIKIDQEGNSQNYLNMADLCISKSGYSTVSECMQSTVPMLLVKRSLFHDDDIVSNAVKTNKLGTAITKPEFDKMLRIKDFDTRLKEMSNFKKYFPVREKRLKEDGNPKTIELLGQYIK